MASFFSNLSKRMRTPLAMGLSCMLAAGLFIWFKLRLVTGMPRSAYAEPEKLSKPVTVQPKAAVETQKKEATAEEKDLEQK